MRAAHWCTRSLAAAASIGLAIAASVASGAPLLPATDVGGTVADGTVWTYANSPYVTTANVVVPEGATLTIEPGVVVQLGASHEIRVQGALHAVGTEDLPIHFEALPDGLNWGTITFYPQSGPSEISHAQILDGGSLRRALVTIDTDDVVLGYSNLRGSQGIGVEVRDGTSPTIHDCMFDLVTDGSANPPAALKILGASDAVVADNLFQSNFQAVNWQADASPTFTGNRFDYNGMNGVVVTGTANRPVHWSNLGPRDWAYFLMSTGVTVAPSGTLTIDPGATLRMYTGASVRVEGALRARGTSTADILFSTQSAEPKPGQWQEITFTDTSADYDAATDTGSVLEHAIIEYGGSSTGRSVFIRDSSPRIANTILRGSGARGIVVTGAEAQPELVGLLIEDNQNDPDGIGLVAGDGAAPHVWFTTFRENFVGFRAESAIGGRIGPHDRFDRNLTFGAQNLDDQTCIDAAGDDWSAADGPQDLSSQLDACGLAEHLGNGDQVSDNINYVPYEGVLPLPALKRPTCGSTSDVQPELGGFAPPLAQVVIYDNQAEIGRTTADQGDEQGIANYSFTPSPLAAGSHVFQVQMVAGESASAVSDPLDIYVDPDLWVDPAYLLLRYDLDGTRYVQPYFHFVGDKGCLALRDDNGWQVRPHPGAPLTLEARLACPAGATPAAAVEYLGSSYPMTSVGNDRYAATFDMGPGGAFDLAVTCADHTRQFHLGNIVTEYEGVLYDQARGILVRVRDATVTLLQYDSSLNNFVVWRGDQFYGQTNPQTTGPAGWYGFYPPPGRYRVQVDAEGYYRYFSSDVDVLEQPVMLSIGMQPKAPAIFLPSTRRNH